MEATTNVSCPMLSHRYNGPPAKTKSNFSAASVVVDTAIPMMERTPVLQSRVTPSTARIKLLLGHHDGSATGQPRRPLQPAERHQSRGHVRTAPTPYRDRLRDHPDAQGTKVNAAVPARHLHDDPVLMSMGK